MLIILVIVIIGITTSSTPADMDIPAFSYGVTAEVPLP